MNTPSTPQLAHFLRLDTEWPQYLLASGDSRLVAVIGCDEIKLTPTNYTFHSGETAGAYAEALQHRYNLYPLLVEAVRLGRDALTTQPSHRSEAAAFAEQVLERAGSIEAGPGDEEITAALRYGADAMAPALEHLKTLEGTESMCVELTEALAFAQRILAEGGGGELARYRDDARTLATLRLAVRQWRHTVCQKFNNNADAVAQAYHYEFHGQVPLNVQELDELYLRLFFREHPPRAAMRAALEYIIRNADALSREEIRETAEEGLKDTPADTVWLLQVTFDKWRKERRLGERTLEELLASTTHEDDRAWLVHFKSRHDAVQAKGNARR